MSIANIESALLDGFEKGNFGFGNSVIYENYKPEGFDENTETYVALTIVINPYRIATLGREGDNEYTGFLQIDLYTRPRTGKHDVLRKAEAIEQHFSTGKTFTYGDQRVEVKNFGIGPSRSEQTHFYTPFTINFKARVARKG